MRHKILLLLFCALYLNAQTIEEKQSSLFLNGDENDLRTSLDALNTQLCQLKRQMHKKYEQVKAYQREGAPAEKYQKLLKEINQIRNEIHGLEEGWHELTVTEGRGEDEGYALWDQEETTLSQLVMEYGSNDYLYIIPPEISSMKLHLHSGIPIPRESWSKLLELILSCNGIGIKQLNPYARQLYILKQDLTAVDQILNTPRDLIRLPPKMRVIYIFSPPPERIRGVIQFFERFRDPKMTFLYQVGYKIALISSREEIEKLLSLYEAVWNQENEKIIKAIPLSRILPEEMEKIVKSYFNDVTNKPRAGLPKGEGEELVTYPLKHKNSLILIGLKEVVKHVERLVRETEEQVEDPTNMTVSWYTCRYGDPADIAEVLEKVYSSLICADVKGESARTEGDPAIFSSTPKGEAFPADTAPTSTLPVHTATHATETIEMQKRVRTNSQMTHFIPYPKTGAIMMVVRRDQLDNINTLIHQLDVPKKMVQIEVLLLEKRIKNENNFGLNLLRLGSQARQVNQTGLKYETGPGTSNRGILDFILSRRRKAHTHPAFDITYNFFMNQEDVRIKAAPSITTINQTPATISLVEEISVDMGATPVDTGKGVTFFSKFVRSQYGTTLTITPTIHTPRYSEDGKHCVTLETNITFDTIKKTAKDDRPPVSRRHITNQVRIVDGETVILGGLCEKTAEDSSNKLPFLGELPGIGKFFGDSRMTDEKTEMFIFITPHIIADNKEELEQLRQEQLIKRPGDLPEFLERIQRAKMRKKEFLFNNSVKLLFGHVDD